MEFQFLKIMQGISIPDFHLCGTFSDLGTDISLLPNKFHISGQNLLSILFMFSKCSNMILYLDLNSTVYGLQSRGWWLLNISRNSLRAIW
jgi:hypothetical protein